MNLNDYTIDIDNNHHRGDLIPYITNDGSLSLKSTFYKESFHSSSGAKKEALEKFIFPSDIDRFALKKELRVLDLCLGLGYNSACLFEEAFKTPITLDWWGIEIDKRPLATALNNSLFKESWTLFVLEILKSINSSSKWEHLKSQGKVLWGDARNKIFAVPKSIHFDLIFHDAFSPNKCPQLWSEEFLFNLVEKLAPGGRLITYSSSAAIRASLKRAGLEIYSTIPVDKNDNRWSNGTIGILPDQNQSSYSHSANWHPLTKMEQEHLLTNAAVPFRDPHGNASSKEILEHRTKEQQISNLSNTSSWRKRWKKQLSS